MAESEKDELEHCVLKGELTDCLRGNCMYWDSELECCTRVSLKMTAKEREEWRKKRKAEFAQIAGGVK